MELLSSNRQEAIRLIREQLCCMLCNKIFEDPQCLDCKHNFCRECIFAHLKKSASSCPTCSIPIFPSEIMRNQFLQSILVAWKVVEHELRSLEAQKHELVLTVDDTDRALQHATGASHLLSPVQTAGASASAANGTPTAGAPSTSASLTPSSGMSRGPVANHKWNIDTKSILKEQKQPKRMTGIAASPLRNDGASTAASPANGANTPGLTQMTPSAPMTVNGASPVTRLASRRRSIFSPSQSQSSSLMDSSSSSMMATQEVEGYLERIQQQNKILNEWEQGRRIASQQRGQSQKHQTATKSTPSKKSGISAMEKLMKNWMSSNSQSSANPPMGGRAAFDRKPAARSLSGMIDAEDEETKGDDDDEDSQTQMPPGGMMESPDLLSNGYALTRLDEFHRTGMIGGSAFPRQLPIAQHGSSLETISASSARAALSSGSHLGLDKVSRSTKRTAKRQVVLSSPPRSSPSLFASRKQAVSVASSQRNGVYEVKDDEDMTEHEGVIDESQLSEVEDSQAPGAFRNRYDTYSRSGSVTMNDTSGDYLQRRKKQRASDDFEGAITAFHSKQKSQPSSTVKPVARLASLKSPKGILNAAMMRNVGVEGGGAPTPGASPGMLSPVPTTRPPRAQSNSARQLVHELRASRNFTLIATDLSRPECKKIATACSLLGGRFGPRFDLRPDPATGVLTSTVTHLIAKSVEPVEERRCKRTAKYMRALAEGCFVVDYSWIDASLDEGKWLPEDAFEMVGDAYSDSVGKPHESHLRRMQTGRRNDIFQMFRFVLLCDEKEFDWQIDSLRGVVENFGATVISEAQYLRMSLERKAKKTQVGIVAKSTTPVDAKDQYEQHQIPIVRVTWIFDSISHLEVLPFDEYYPY